MVDFTRAKGTPQDREPNAKVGTPNNNTPMMDYERVGDLGIDAGTRDENLAQAQSENVGKGTSFVSGVKQSVLYNAVNKAFYQPNFDPLPSYDATIVLPDDARVKQYRPNEDELKYLKGANSPAEYEYRWTQIPQQRQEEAQLAANPVSGVAGALIGDSPSLLVPALGEAALGRTAATALRIATNTFDLGAAVYTQNELGQSEFNTALVAGLGSLDSLFLLRKGFAGAGAVRTAERSVDDVATSTEKAAADAGNAGPIHTDTDPDAMKHAQDTGVVPPTTVKPKADSDDLVVDPDSPVMPVQRRDLDADVESANNTTPTRPLGTPDYQELDSAIIDTSKATGDLTMKRISVAGKPLGEIPLRPAMYRAADRADELAAAGKLPEDFPRYYRQMLEAIGDNLEGVPLKIDRKVHFRAYYHPNSIDFSGEHVRVAMPNSVARTGKITAGQLIDSMEPSDLRTMMHEAIHAATDRAIRMHAAKPDSVSSGAALAISGLEKTRQLLRSELARRSKEGTLTKQEQHYIGYYLQNNSELIAGLGDAQGGYLKFLHETKAPTGKESMLRSLSRSILSMMGFKPNNQSALTRVVDSLTDLLAQGRTGTGKLGEQALSDYAPEFMSASMQPMTDAGRTAAKGRNAEEKAAKAMFGDFKNTMRRFFALHDSIAEGSQDARNFADWLVADGTKVGERADSVVDIKRRLHSEMNAIAADFEKGVSDALAEQGIGKVQQFFYRSEFTQARKAMEKKVTDYLNYAHGEYRNGRTVNPPDADIAKLVQRYTDSGWAEKWHDYLSQAGLNPEGRFEKSPYYLPRRYNADKLRAMQKAGYEQADFVDLFSAAMRDTYPAMDRDLSRQVARTWYQGMTTAQPTTGAMWRRSINGLSNDEFYDILTSAGVSTEDANKILSRATGETVVDGKVMPRTGSSATKNLRKRNDMDMQKEYTTSSGKIMKLGDLLDTDVTKLMSQYNNRMSGRAALASKGMVDLKDLANQIDDLRNAGNFKDVGTWTRKVDDTVDVIMGYPAMGDTPDALLAAGYLSNAMMLKNSGLYQLTDLSLSMKEFGFTRTMRAMMSSGLFKHARVELGRDASLHGRLDNVLNGSIQADMRFRWLHTYADDNTDLTRSHTLVNVARNLGQAAYTANGMRAIHRAMVNLNAGIVRDNILSALGGNAKDAAFLQRFGLRSDALEQMRAAFKTAPDKPFSNELQQHLEIVGQRAMDYVVQQVRTGETSHFAEMNPIGRVVIGYQSFALAATNKILRRHLENGEYLGLAMLAAYQIPMMLMAEYAKAGMDGKLDKTTTKDLVTNAVSGTSMIGGLTIPLSMFLGDGTQGISMLGSVNNVTSTLSRIASKGSMSAQDASRMLPLAQEFIPLRTLINNLGQ